MTTITTTAPPPTGSSSPSHPSSQAAGSRTHEPHVTSLFVRRPAVVCVTDSLPVTRLMKPSPARCRHGARS